jgi:hypothetical protein
MGNWMGKAVITNRAYFGTGLRPVGDSPRDFRTKIVKMYISSHLPRRLLVRVTPHLAVVWLILCSPPSTLSQTKTRKDIPAAPLPSAITQAHKAFLVNGQTTSQYLTKNGNTLAFDSLYDALKSWGRYELVDSPAGADIVVELQYRPYSEGSRTFGVYNPSTRTTQARTVDRFGADFVLIVYDAKSKEQLWFASDQPGAALIVKNQQKEVIKSINRLVATFKARSPQ